LGMYSYQASAFAALPLTAANPCRARFRS
jgi:hypothetical protein